MPDYKRKKVKKSFKHKKIRTNENNDIVMSNKKDKTSGIVPKNDIKVVRGAKYKRQKRRNAFLVFVFVVAIIYTVLSLVLPAGLYENIVNFTSLIGHGSYPAEIHGSTVLNTVSNGSYYYVLTDTNITAYTNSGKTVLNDMHGFSNPIISVSSTRALVYDQGGKTVYVYNLGGKIHTIETDNEIITAGISRCGAFAVATHSESYTSVANVYDKDGKQIYTWNSAKDIINNVLLNTAGNKLAVTTLNVISGQYYSKMMILNFESADPLHTAELGSSIVLSLENTGKGISLIATDKYKFIHWSKFSSNEVTASGEMNMLRRSKNGLLLVFNRVNDRSDNTVILISNKGEKTKEFKINNIITDIQYAKSRIYYISDTEVNILDRDGNQLGYGYCNYGTQKFAVIASNAVATVSDSEIIKTNIEKGE